MKHKLLLLPLLAGSLSAWGQTHSGLQPAPNLPTNREISTPEGPFVKTLLCQDTLRYPQAKEQIHGTPTFYLFDVWQADNEAFSQTYLNSTSHSISGIEFYGANNDVDGMPTVTVAASIYSVDASNVPVTLLASGTTTFSSATAGYHYVSFTPITVTGNYAVVIQATNTDGIVSLYVNDRLTGQPYDENLSRFRSDYYDESAGAYVSIPVLTNDPVNFNAVYDFEPLVAPIVSYTINTSFTVAQDPSCLGTPVNYTNTSTPSALLGNRMYSFQYFMDYFNLATSDSTFVWDMDNTVEVWSSNHTYTYPAAGAYDPMLITIGGFWNTCVDFATDNVVINAVPAAPSITPGGPTTFCPGGSVTLTSSAASNNNWNTGATTPAITASASGNYTVTTTVAGCTSPASAPVAVTVSPLDDASIAYSSNTLCSGGGNETPTITTAGGTFSAPAGISIDPSTGEIDVAASTEGTYAVTYTTAGTCPNSSITTIVITSAPDAAFTYANSTYCTGDSDPAPVFGAGASAGVFSSTTGLSINGAGQIDLSASTAGTYTVTNTIAAAGACPASSETFDVTINQTPSATVSGGGSACGTGTVPVTITLTGTGPWDIIYTDGTDPIIVTGQATSPYTITAASSGTYTVTQVTQGSCSAAGSGAATVAINPNPTVTFDDLDDVCANGGTVTLSGAAPAGGTFSGTGVTGNAFDAATAGAGTFTITYAYTDANGCSASATSDITVNAAPAVTFGAVAALCVYDAAVTLVATPAGGTFSGAGVTGTSFDPDAAGEGTHTISYTYTDANDCSNGATQDIIVDDCLGMEELEGANMLIVPNPASDKISVSYTGETAVTELALLTADGKIVSRKAVSGALLQETMDVSTLAEGVYFVRLTTAKGAITQKVVIR